MTPDELRAEVALLREDIAQLRRGLAKLATEPAAAVVESIARTLGHIAYVEQVIAELSAKRLTVKPPGNTVSGVTSAQRQAISEKLMRKDPNMSAARKAGVPSLRQLAAQLGVTASFLSQVRSGTRPMPDTLAAKFKALTGQDWV